MGYQPFDPREMQEFGFGRYPNVITSMQYERLASRSGPTEGVVARPSDGRPPQKIAWLQCIGSRDQKYPYCSAICCMYATKEAMLAKQRLPDAETHIFTMDERAFNKEYNAYYLQRARRARRAIHALPHFRDSRRPGDARPDPALPSRAQARRGACRFGTGAAGRRPLRHGRAGRRRAAARERGRTSRAPWTSSSTSTASARPTSSPRWRPRGPASSCAARSPRPKRSARRSLTPPARRRRPCG